MLLTTLEWTFQIVLGGWGIKTVCPSFYQEVYWIGILFYLWNQKSRILPSVEPTFRDIPRRSSTFHDFPRHSTRQGIWLPTTSPPSTVHFCFPQFAIKTKTLAMFTSIWPDDGVEELMKRRGNYLYYLWVVTAYVTLFPSHTKWNRRRVSVSI